MKRNSDRPNDVMSDLEDIGRQLGRAARDLSRSSTVRELKHSVKRAARDIVGEAQRRVQPPIVQEPPPAEPFCPEPPPPPPPTPAPPPVVRRIPRIPSASIAGILLTVFGFVGMGVFALFALIVLMMILSGVVASGALYFMLALYGVIGAVCGVMGGKGVSLSRRHQRLRLYWKEIGTSDFCPVALLASAVKKDERFVARDLTRLLGDGKFPGAKLDTAKTCLILNPETYEQYLLAEETMRRKRAEEAEREKARKRKPPEPDSPEAAALAEGERMLREIRQANDLIPGEEISRKISRIETITEKIFDCVRQHPEKLPEIRKFMSYYLPTTLKLLNHYHEFDVQPVQGAHIVQGKAEISEALDTVGKAFENLLDSLFEDSAFDVATDISVLETMLAQEGLTGQDDFKEKGQGK